MINEPILEKLIQSPKLSLYLDQLQQLLQKEQEERRRFYDTVKEGDKAEFINGQIIFSSPVKLRHNESGAYLLTLLNAYVRIHDLGLVGYEKMLITLTRNDYEPDICFFFLEKADRFLPDQMQFPAPDFIVEILSDSTVERDRGVKFEDYAAHGVTEYWLIDPKAEFVEQYTLAEETYTLVQKSGTGLLQSIVIPGFDIPVRAIFDGTENLQALQQLVSR